ncbi:MAG TPA: ribonuclease PH, partial [Thermoanaerobaculia bacterium]
ADGGTRCAGITGACVAVAIALAKLVREDAIRRWPMRETVAAVSVGICAGQPVLDLGYAEDSEADVDCNIVGTASGAFVELQGTAERRPFTEERLAELIALARVGLARLRAEQERVLEPLLQGIARG